MVAIALNHRPIFFTLLVDGVEGCNELILYAPLTKQRSSYLPKDLLEGRGSDGGRKELGHRRRNGEQRNIFASSAH